jgi:hypothetical protein
LDAITPLVTVDFSEAREVVVLASTIYAIVEKIAGIFLNFTARVIV